MPTVIFFNYLKKKNIQRFRYTLQVVEIALFGDETKNCNSVENFAEHNSFISAKTIMFLLLFILILMTKAKKTNFLRFFWPAFWLNHYLR